jgi:hypothetical protein
MLSFPILLQSTVLLATCFCQDYSEPKKHSEQAKQAEQPKQVEDSWLISTSATVDAIDQKTRIVTLRGSQGNTTTFKVDDSVKNLDQIKAGDKVVADYYVSLAFQVVKVGAKEGTPETMVYTAEPGEKPAAAAARQLSMVATVEAIDHSAPSITLKDSKGNMTTVKVRHPERLKLVKVGDTLKITYREALVVAVEPAPKETH